MNLRAAYILRDSTFSDLDDIMSNDDASTSSPNTLSNVISCLSDYDPNALPVADAQSIIQQFIKPIDAVEKVAIRSALDRVLAVDIVSPINVPSHDNSAMDGYAFAGSELRAESDIKLKVIATAYAGRAYKGTVGDGECVRIMTGAVMPHGCDTVIPQEFTRDESETGITIPAGAVKVGDNRRLKGEDLSLGTPALQKGRVLRPADLGLLASLGVGEIPVQRHLRVAFFSTGDELRSIGETLDEGCVFDSNRYTLYGMLKRMGCDIVDMGVIKDDPASLEAAFRTACENADAIVTSGGVSVGAADYTKQMMAQLGDVTFWKIGMRPGRPMAFGQIASNGKSAYLFGLPGNPVAVMVTFYFLARQALLHMMGAKVTAPLLMKARSISAIRKRPGRTEYQRGIVTLGSDGMQEVRITGSQGSGVLRSMSEANCMVVLEHERAEVKAGDLVDVILFDGLV
jgi:molybdopterin molybdotransferase